MPEKYEQSAYYKTEAVEEEMIKKNRRERLEAARGLLESIIVTPDDEKEKKKKKGRNGKKVKKDENGENGEKDKKDENKKDEDGENKRRNRNGKKGKEKEKKRVENMKKCYAREMEELKEKELEPREKLATYQNNPELKKELLKKKAEAYSTERRTTETERKFKKGEISIEYCDKRSGVVLVTGSILDAGKTDEGLEAVQKTVKKMIRDGKRRMNEEGDDQETEEAVMCLEDILKADNGNEELWVASTHADLSAGRRRKESIKRICDSIAAENNAWPYIPMTNGQFFIMNWLYWGDTWKEKSWRTLDSIDAIMEKVTEFQRHFPSSVTPLVKTLMMSQGASLTTLNRIIDMMQGKGLTVTQEVDSIGRVSKLLLL